MTAVPLTAAELSRRLRARATPERAAVSQRFFKTGAGEYGEGDLFIGVTVPDTRAVARPFRGLPRPELCALLDSAVHEERLAALLLMVEEYRRGDAAAKRAVFDLYMRKLDAVNNWDLVDLSAPGIVGAHLLARSRRRLHDLARSRNLWRRRVAIVSTMEFIRHGQLDDTFAIAEVLLDDPEDLIHKAAGWMLREAGKRDTAAEEAFLARHHARMPRTMLRYAIERFPEPKRKRFLRGEC